MVSSEALPLKIEVISTEADRTQRDIIPMGTDYLPDDPNYDFGKRVEYYKKLHSEFGLEEIRTEFRLKTLIPKSEKGKPIDKIQFDQTVRKRYVESLQAMAEAGMKNPTLVLFSPDKWQVEPGAETEYTNEDVSELYRRFTEEIKQICVEASVTPKYIQVMNEINFSAQTAVPLDQVVEMIKTTNQVFAQDDSFKQTKIMTTVYSGTTREEIDGLIDWMKNGVSNIPVIGGAFAEFIKKGSDALGRRIDASMIGKLLDPYMRWQDFVKNLVDKAGDSLQAIGFDFYPGSYNRPAISLKKSSSLAKSRPYHSYGETAPYKWIAEQKLNGFLKQKDILIAETGVFAPSVSSRQQELGYLRLIQSFDHLLLHYERQGYKASDIFKSIIFFQMGEHEGVDVKAPMSLDFRPWTLLRKDKQGNWVSTKAAEVLKYLIQSRIKYQEHDTDFLKNRSRLNNIIELSPDAKIVGKRN